MRSRSVCNTGCGWWRIAEQATGQRVHRIGESLFPGMQMGGCASWAPVRHAVTAMGGSVKAWPGDCCLGTQGSQFCASGRQWGEALNIRVACCAEVLDRDTDPEKRQTGARCWGWGLGVACLLAAAERLADARSPLSKHCCCTRLRRMTSVHLLLYVCLLAC